MAFSGCSSLKSAVLPGSLTSIPWGAFDECTALPSVTIPDAVTTIESGAFRECTALASLVMPDSVKSIGSSAFQGCPSAVIYYEGSADDWDSLFASLRLQDDVSKIVFDYTPAVPGAVDEPVLAQSSIGPVVTGISATKNGFSVDMLRGKLTVPEGDSFELVTAQGEPMTGSSVLCTGDTFDLTQSDGNTERYTVIIRGDVLGTGKMTLSQLVAMCRALKGTTTLTGPYLLAGDFTQSGAVTLSDLVAEASLLRDTMVGRMYESVSRTHSATRGV